jgi:2-polyprenyl-3-methyl-5-hydroxy-6-metoxy-1,4-benzoquinol methylase
MTDLSKFTERLTDKDFLKVELDNGISLDNPQFMDLAKNTVAQVQGYGQKIIDYGCGVGAYAKAAMELGFQVEAIEKFKAHRDYLKQRIPELKIINKLKNVDIMLFIEVAEHMTDNELFALFEQATPIWILFSSTPHKTANDEQWGHINVKQPKEWDELFLKIGYRTHKNLTLPTEWSKIYQLI